MMKPKHQTEEWLREQADKGLWYGAIAKIANVKPPTIVKWMLKFGVFTKIPLTSLGHYAEITQNDNLIFSTVLMGNPAIKKNSNTTSKGIRLPNKNYVPYADYNLAVLQQINAPKISQPVTLRFHFYKDSHRRTDISNLYEAPQDLLVNAGVLEDDNSSIVVSHHSLSRVLYDPVYPRTELFIYPVIT